LADRELVGQGGGPVGDADAVGADAAAVARDDTAGETDEADDAGDTGGEATLDAVADEAPVVEAPPAGAAAEEDAPVLHPATLIPTTAAAATAARRPADRVEPNVEPNIADLFPAAQAPQPQLSVT
jgi:hypothetical protein